MRRTTVRTRTYVAVLSPVDRRRYAHVKQGGEIVNFTVQYETLVEGEWRAVVRYDSAHGIAHKDVLDAAGHEEKHLLGVGSLKEAIAIADADIQQNWERYKARFLKRGRRR